MECAAAQDHFSQMQAAVFAKQDSFGLKPWPEYAREAGVQDTVRFSACMKDSALTRRVADGLSAAIRHQFHATPTLIINGWQLAYVPDTIELESQIEKALSGIKLSDTTRGRIVRADSSSR